MGWIITGQKATDLNTSGMRTLTQRHTSFAGGAPVIFHGIQAFTSFDLAFAYTQDQRPETLQQIQNYTDYWWEKRDDRGLLRIESRSPKEAERFFETNAPTQTFSLGISLLESAVLIESLLPELANQMRQYGLVYIDGFLAAPHNLKTREFISLCQCETDRIVERMSALGAVSTVPGLRAVLECYASVRMAVDPE